MLYIVLILVLAALGLLVAALSTASTLWAWLSIVVSLAGATILFLDWLGNRRVSASPEESSQEESSQEEWRAESEPADDPWAEEPVEAVEPVAAVAEDVPDTSDVPDDEPGEESTDAADLLVVAALTVEVRVVDERPRYHLAACAWLAGRPTLGVPVAEARQLGFTPCARCTPDASLATRHRDAKRQRT
ncbi:hypothetical protein ACTG9Q_30475 [Actinokineospora sp. 24-640]